MKTSTYWKPGNLEEIWSGWIAPLKYIEPCLIVTFPGSDIIRRADQLFENQQYFRKELGVKQITVSVVDYRIDRWVGVEEMYKQIDGSSVGERLVWVYGFEQMLKDKRADLIIALQKLYREDKTRLVLVCEGNYYDPAYEEMLLNLPSFEPRIVVYGKYEVRLLEDFVYYLAEKWEMKLDSKLVVEIVKAVGSSLRLLKSVIWQLRDQVAFDYHSALDSQELLWQVKAIWHKLNVVEREVMVANTYRLRVGEQLAMVSKYLNDMGYMGNPLLQDYIKKYVGNPMEIKIDADQLFIGGHDYSSNFTSKQKTILRLVLINPGVCVTRRVN